MKKNHPPQAKAIAVQPYAPGVRATPLGAALIASALAFPVGMALSLADWLF